MALTFGTFLHLDSPAQPCSVFLLSQAAIPSTHCSLVQDFISPLGELGYQEEAADEKQRKPHMPPAGPDLTSEPLPEDPECTQWDGSIAEG